MPRFASERDADARKAAESNTQRQQITPGRFSLNDFPARPAGHITIRPQRQTCPAKNGRHKKLNPHSLDMSLLIRITEESLRHKSHSMDGTLFRADNRILRMLGGSLVHRKAGSPWLGSTHSEPRAGDDSSYEHRPTHEPIPALQPQRPPHFHNVQGHLKHGQACREG
jgi:hypothetical protein